MDQLTAKAIVCATWMSIAAWLYWGRAGLSRAVLIGVAMLVVGCGGPATVEKPAAATGVVGPPPTCVVDMTQPWSFRGSQLWSEPASIVCNVSTFADVLQLRYLERDADFMISIDVDRTRAAAGNSYDLGDAATAWLPGDKHCDGVLTWELDSWTSLDKAWALSIDAVCGDLPVVAGWRGRDD